MAVNYFEIKDLKEVPGYTDLYPNEDMSFPQPSSVSFKEYHIVNKERTLNGTLVVDYINSKEMIDVTWDILSDENFALLQKLFDSKKTTSNLFYTLSFMKGGKTEGIQTLQEIEAYTEEISYYPFFTGDDNVVWRDVTISFVEQ